MEDDCDTEWCQFSIGENITATQVSGNDLALLLVVQDGTSDSLAAIWFGDSEPNPIVTDHDDNMFLDVVIPQTKDGLSAAHGKHQPNWLGSNPASPPKYELVLEVTWDGVGAPAIEIFTWVQGTIHGLFATDDGFLATGTSDTISITESDVK